MLKKYISRCQRGINLIIMQFAVNKKKERENSMSGQDEPNDETLEAFAEVEEMKRMGNGQRFDNLNDLWASFEE